ncbi:hypothetical protein OSSY52_08380 [Tepiditoga spiralis]|uniref:Lipoprotein n=1 Tax=Tepiditoga spiralis TaxID=2108365 RepID=A0A7G1G707_9BACT|nr:hypothetical protein [Tepiditoga spiralis]BBE30697.1 hypothetical protein OSSY52_08380 [Tepiditoga spiralis]
MKKIIFLMVILSVIFVSSCFADPSDIISPEEGTSPIVNNNY